MRVNICLMIAWNLTIDRNEKKKYNIRGGLAKCNPLAYWTLEDTFDYIAKYKVPHHPLHAKGYPSIG